MKDDWKERGSAEIDRIIAEINYYYPHRKEGYDNAIEKRKLEENYFQKHQDGNESRKTAEAGGGDCGICCTKKQEETLKL